MNKKKPTTKKIARATSKASPIPATDLVAEVRSLIDQARSATAQAVNSALVLLYWSIGDRVRTEVLKNKRAEYGQEILSTLSQELVRAYGNGYSVPNLSRMLRFAEVFPKQEIVVTLSRQLGWSHFVEILPMKDQLKRDFYAEMCRIERWSVRKLRDKINGLLFERTALSRKPEKLAEQELAQLRETDQLTPDMVFRDPYFLDFLGLKDTYAEKDIEAGVTREIESFLLELGDGFTFAARQKRMVIDGEDFYLDLLFYHRRLHRLVAIDLLCGGPHNRSSVAMRVMWRSATNALDSLPCLAA